MKGDGLWSGSSVDGQFFQPLLRRESLQLLQLYELVFKKAVIPSDEELSVNNRSHSAKMRAIRKIKED